MSVPLYFPDGVPPNIQRIVDPDVIHQLVRDGLAKVETEWKKLARRSDDLAQGKLPWWRRLWRSSYEVDKVYVMNTLYRPTSEWSIGKSKPFR